jgi:hypothetical protein
VIEGLPTVWEALGSIPSTTKGKEGRMEGREERKEGGKLGGREVKEKKCISLH